ncbi:hypothetical protein LXL04_001442 [Taraxacum kok-saghyz]
MNPRISSASYNGVRSFATLLISRYKFSPSTTTRLPSHHDMRLSKFGYGIGSSMHQSLSISSGNSMKMPKSKMEQEDGLKAVPSDPAPPRRNIFYWVKWVLGSILPFLFSSWKKKWDNMLKLEDKLDEIVKEGEELAEVVEKVASTTEKLSAEVAEHLNNGELKEIALKVEHVSSVALKEAQMTEKFLHKVGDLEQDLKKLENMLIKPSKSTPENLRRFKLSLLDQLASSSSIHLIFYYKAGDDLNISDKRTQLVKSLSEALTLFYPLAGKITEDGLAVDCNDQGVKYLEVHVPIRFDNFLDECPNSDQINQLVAPPDQLTTTLITIQVNLFDCGAIAIGVSTSHKVTDACNLIRFINEWATHNRTGGSDGDFSPSFDNLDSFFPPTNISSSNHSLKIPNNPESIVLLKKKFVFNGSSISKLRAKINPSSILHRGYSRVTLVASLIWKTLISIDKVNNGSFRDCLLAPALNLRGKVGSPISSSSFGNVWAPYPIRYHQNGLELIKYADLATLIEDTTKNKIEELSRASGEEICKQAMACYAEVAEELKENKFCIFTSWCRFPLYEVDFGWGKPYWVSEAGGSVQMAVLMDDKNGEGIEAWVSLNEKDMCVFEQDQAILAFTS